jgi:hypothetical protein
MSYVVSLDLSFNQNSHCRESTFNINSALQLGYPKYETRRK